MSHAIQGHCTAAASAALMLHSSHVCVAVQELMQLSEAQVQDALYLHQLEIARSVQLKAQREQAVVQLLGSSSSSMSNDILKQHPSDSITLLNSVADELRQIGVEQYKLRGIVYDAFFHGVRPQRRQHSHAARCCILSDSSAQHMELYQCSQQACMFLASCKVMICSHTFRRMCSNTARPSASPCFYLGIAGKKQQLLCYCCVIAVPPHTMNAPMNEWKHD